MRVASIPLSPPAGRWLHPSVRSQQLNLVVSCLVRSTRYGHQYGKVLMYVPGVVQYTKDGFAVSPNWCRPCEVVAWRIHEVETSPIALVRQLQTFPNPNAANFLHQLPLWCGGFQVLPTPDGLNEETVEYMGMLGGGFTL